MCTCSCAQILLVHVQVCITNTRTHRYILSHTYNLTCINKLEKMFRFGRISSQGPGKPATSFHHRLEDIFVDLKTTPQSLQHEPGRITCLHRLVLKTAISFSDTPGSSQIYPWINHTLKKKNPATICNFKFLGRLWVVILYIFFGETTPKNAGNKTPWHHFRSCRGGDSLCCFFSAPA